MYNIHHFISTLGSWDLSLSTSQAFHIWNRSLRSLKDDRLMLRAELNELD